MEFKKFGNIVFHHKIFDSVWIRTQINHIKNNINSKIQSKEPIALAVNRDENLIPLILALIESNITFIPIDLKLPEERILYMLQNAKVKTIVVSDDKGKGYFNDYNIILINDLLEIGSIITGNNNQENKNPVYLLYTSGSTGYPKAVSITVEGFMNFINSVPNIINFSETATIACFTTISFDIFFLEAILGIVKGLTVVLADEEEQLNPKKMIDLIISDKITMLQSTPSRLKLLQIYDKELSFLKKIKILMIGGETFPIDLLKSLQKYTTAKIYNMYGPTETTIWSTISDLTNANEIDIGKPIANTTIYILKDRKEIAKNGEEGEICISGVGLANGYYNNDLQTDKVFITLQNIQDKRIYCTGDLGVFKNNKLYCLGRIDNQVKINGYRIELEEIESVLKKMELIEDVAVCYKKNENILVVFYKSAKKIQKHVFVEYAKTKLPEYMIPAKFFQIENFLYTTSGKIDRKSLVEFCCSDDVTEIDSKENSDSIFDEVVNIIIQQLNYNGKIFPDTSIASFSFNSISYMTLLVSLEEKYNIEFDEEYLLPSSFNLLIDLISYIEKKIRY